MILIVCLDLTGEEKSLTLQIKTKPKLEMTTVTQYRPESTGTTIIKLGYVCM